MDYEYKGHKLDDLRPPPNDMDKGAVLRFLSYPNYWGAAARQQLLKLSPEDQLWVVDKLVEQATANYQGSPGQQEHDVVMRAILDMHGAG